MMYMTIVGWLYCSPGGTWGTRILRMRPAWLTTDIALPTNVQFINNAIGKIYIALAR
jgi:hypothetical protein